MEEAFFDVRSMVARHPCLSLLGSYDERINILDRKALEDRAVS